MSEHQGARPPGRGLKIALALSLAVNLAIAGLVIGAMIGGGPRGGDDPRLRAMGLGPFGTALSRADRADLAARMDRGALRDTRRALGEDLGTFRAALTAEPFDRDGAQAALARTRAATEALQGIGHDAILDQIAAMTLAERAALAQRLDRALRRMGGHGPHR
jgi:hypothetical protein